MDVGNIIKSNRLRLGLSQEQLGIRLNVNKAAVSKWELGDVQNLKRNTIQQLAELFDINPATLVGINDDYLRFDNIFKIQTKRFPLLGEIACGVPIFAAEDRESYVEASTEIRADFCLKAKGDSMINARIMDGDIVFIREQNIVNNGDIAAVIIDDEATLKRVYYDHENGILQLVAENPRYSPLVYVGEALNEVRILGLAVAFQSDVI